MRAPQDNRLPPARWWRMAAAMPLAFGLFCLLTRSWTPLQVGWPLIVGVFLLAVIRQGVDLYERRGGRHSRHA